MSLFKRQLTAAREQRVEVDLQVQDSVATESLEADVSQEIDVDAIMDQFAEDRDRLNAMLEDGSLTEAGLESDGGTQVIEQEAAAEEVVATESTEVVAEAEEKTPGEDGVSQTETAETTQEETPVVAEQVEEAGAVTQEEQEAAVEQTETVVAEQVEDTTEIAQEASEEVQVVAEASEEVSQEEPEKNEDLPDDAVPGYDEDEEDETVVAEMAIMEEVESDVVMIEQYTNEMAMISDSIVAIESFGINPSAIAILQTTGLLSDTVLDAVGVESLGYAGPKDDNTLIALEALEAKGEAKSAGWAAKIMSMAKSVGSKIMSVIGGIWEKITGVVGKIGSATWDMAKAGGRVVKAHPYKTILAVVAAIAAVAGIVVFMSGGLAGLAATEGAGATALAKIISFNEKVASKVSSIKWPFGKVAAEAAEGTGKLSLAVTSNVAAPEAMALSKTGWTQTVVKGVNSTLSRAWTGIKDGASALGAAASKAGSSAAAGAKTFSKSGVDTFVKTNEAAGGILKKRGSMFSAKGAGAHLGVFAAASFVAGTIKFIYGLVFKVVAFGLRVIYNTMKAIAGAVTGGKTAEA